MRFSVNHPFSILLLTLMIAMVGWYSFENLPIDAMPDVTNNQLQINTQLEGLSTEDAESSVTFPLETAMRGIAGVEQVRSMTGFNLSQLMN